jgi:hypothetical protein
MGRLAGPALGRGRPPPRHYAAGHNVTGLFAELEPLGTILGGRQAILDGEMVAWGDDGRPDFGRLFSRFRGRSPRAVHQAKAEAPVTWVALREQRRQGSPPSCRSWPTPTQAAFLLSAPYSPTTPTAGCTRSGKPGLRTSLTASRSVLGSWEHLVAGQQPQDKFCASWPYTARRRQPPMANSSASLAKEAGLLPR